MSLFDKWLDEEEIIIRRDKKEIVTKFNIYEVDGTDCGPREKGDFLLGYGWGYGAKIVNKSKPKCKICKKWIPIGFPAFFLSDRWDNQQHDNRGRPIGRPFKQDKKHYFHPDCLMKAIAHMSGFIAMLQSED